MKKQLDPKRTKSNTAALVAAVLVATLSLFVNQLFRITPEKIDVMKGSFASLKSISLEMVSRVSGDDASTTPEVVAQRKPAQIIADLEQLKKQLDLFFAAYVRSGIPESEKLKPFVTVVAKASGALESQAEAVSSAQMIQGRMLVFQNYFLAAGICPEAYSADFAAACDRLLSDPNFGQANAVKLYQALNELRLYADADQTALQKLQEFSSQQSDQAYAIQLYLLLANVMEQNGRRELSCLILRQGMSIYRSHPDRHRLVNRLLDLKFEKPG